MNLLWLLVIVLLALALAGSPVGYSWYGPTWTGSGIGGVIVIVLIVMILTGRL